MWWLMVMKLWMRLSDGRWMSGVDMCVIYVNGVVRLVENVVCVKFNGGWLIVDEGVE